MTPFFSILFAVLDFTALTVDICTVNLSHSFPSQPQYNNTYRLIGQLQASRFLQSSRHSTQISVCICSLAYIIKVNTHSIILVIYILERSIVNSPCWSQITKSSDLFHHASVVYPLNYPRSSFFKLHWMDWEGDMTRPWLVRAIVIASSRRVFLSE